LVRCVFIPLRKDGIELIHDICYKEETTTDRASFKRIRIAIINFSSEMIEIAASYNMNVNDDSEGLKHILIKGEAWMEMEKIITKEPQLTLKIALKKTAN
jgi:hypothetical protein